MAEKSAKQCAPWINLGLREGDLHLRALIEGSTHIDLKIFSNLADKLNLCFPR